MNHEKISMNDVNPKHCFSHILISSGAGEEEVF